MIRSSTYWLGVVGVLLLSVGARAADVPGNASTTAKLKVEVANPALTAGTFEFQADSDWYRVSLEKGKHYFVAVSGWALANGGSVCLVQALVRNRNGKILKSGLSDFDFDNGFEFLAPATNTFFVEYRPASQTCIPTTLPFGYGARVSTDCAGGPATTCVQSVGQTRKSMLGGAADIDWFRTSLSTAHRYTIRAEPLDGCAGDFSVAILNSSGAIVSQGPEGISQIDGFRPGRDGLYFLKVATGDDCRVVYRLSLHTP